MSKQMEFVTEPDETGLGRIIFNGKFYGLPVEAIAALQEAIKTHAKPAAWICNWETEPSGIEFTTLTDDKAFADTCMDKQPLYTSAPTIPEGWRLVPEEPTPEMIEAGHKNIDWCRDGQVTNVSVHPSQTEVVLDGEVIAHAGTTCADDVTDAYKAMLAAATCQGEKP